MARAVSRKLSAETTLELMRQEPLLDELNSIAPGVKRHRPEVAGAAMDGDVQTTSTFIFRILVSILR